jgi:hypothetical protein
MHLLCQYVHPVKPVNTKTALVKIVAKMIATQVLPLTMIKRPVTNVLLVNTKIKQIKSVANPIALPVFSLTFLEQSVTNVLTNTKIKHINLNARIVPLVLP